jgi:hypothetical protein
VAHAEAVTDLVTAAPRRGRHGVSSTPEYRTWESIHRRCNNPAQPSYRYYGARGVTVAPAWSGRGGFERFFAELGLKPTPRHRSSASSRSDLAAKYGVSKSTIKAARAGRNWGHVEAARAAKVIAFAKRAERVVMKPAKAGKKKGGE